MTEPKSPILELKKIMAEKGVTQRKLAYEVNTDVSKISEILRKRRKFTAASDYEFCKFFKLKQGYFLRLQVECDIYEYNEELENEKKWKKLKK